MKKILTLGAMALMLMCGVAKAQDCEYIVSFIYGTSMPMVPPSKIDYWCRMNTNTLFVCNTVPTGARVYSIGELKDKRTRMHLPSDYVVNFDSLSLYRYDFENFQDLDETVYFLTERSEYRYLGVRGYKPMLKETGEPDTGLDKEWEKQFEEEESRHNKR